MNSQFTGNPIHDAGVIIRRHKEAGSLHAACRAAEVEVWDSFKRSGGDGAGALVMAIRNINDGVTPSPLG